MSIVIRNRKDGPAFQVKLYVAGTWITRTFDEEKAAKEWEQSEKLKLSPSAGLDYRSPKKVTFHEFWGVWSEANRRKASRGWKISQDQMYRDYIYKPIGGLRLSDITPAHVGQILAKMEKLDRAAQTRLLVYNLLNKVFKDAIEFYRMAMVTPVLPAHHRPAVPRTERRFLTPEQAILLLRTASTHPFMDVPVFLDTFAGLRTEATVALDWSDIEWDKSQLVIRRAWKAKIRLIQDHPKGKDHERVPIAPVLLGFLRDVWTRRGEPTKGFVCVGPHGDMLRPETLGPNLKRLCLIAGVPRITPHELRHSCTELFVRHGASQEDIRRLLNHKSAATTSRYMHRTDERLQSIASRVGSEIKGMAGMAGPLILGKEMTEIFSQIGKKSEYETEALSLIPVASTGSD